MKAVGDFPFDTSGVWYHSITTLQTDRNATVIAIKKQSVSLLLGFLYTSCKSSVPIPLITFGVAVCYFSFSFKTAEIVIPSLLLVYISLTTGVLSDEPARCLKQRKIQGLPFSNFWVLGKCLILGDVLGFFRFLWYPFCCFRNVDRCNLLMLGLLIDIWILFGSLVWNTVSLATSVLLLAVLQR